MRSPRQARRREVNSSSCLVRMDESESEGGESKLWRESEREIGNEWEKIWGKKRKWGKILRN